MGIAHSIDEFQLGFKSVFTLNPELGHGFHPLSTQEWPLSAPLRPWIRSFLRRWRASTATDANCESAVTTPQHSMRDANNPAGQSLISILVRIWLGSLPFHIVAVEWELERAV